MQSYVSRKPVAWFLALVLIGLSLATFMPKVPVASADPSGQVGLVVPLYTYPTDSSWSTVIQAKQAYPNVPIIAVVDPANGPGSFFDPNYAQGIADLQAAGVQVFGYVYTSYAARDPGSVEADVNTYSAWYHVNGIFLDEMSNDPGSASYYSGITDYVQSLGIPTTIGNAGISVPTDEVGSVSIICVSETGALPSLPSISYPGYSTSNFLVISYDQPSLDTSFIQQASSYASWFYLTDGSGSNPYDVLPSYFWSEVAAIASLGTATLTVHTVDLSGDELSGIWAAWSGANTYDSGFTPYAFTGPIGSTYAITVSNYQNYVFCYWQDGSTNPSRSVTLSGDTDLTAYYSTTGWCPTAAVPVQVLTFSTSGLPFDGMWLTVESNGNVVAQGFSPLSFNAIVGSTYTVTASDWGSYVFQSWSWGGADPSLTIYPTQLTTVFAYYSING